MSCCHVLIQNLPYKVCLFPWDSTAFVFILPIFFLSFKNKYFSTMIGLCIFLYIKDRKWERHFYRESRRKRWYLLEKKEKMNNQNKRWDVDVSISFHKFMASEGGMKVKCDILHEQIQCRYIQRNSRTHRLGPPLTSVWEVEEREEDVAVNLMQALVLSWFWSQHGSQSSPYNRCVLSLGHAYSRWKYSKTQEVLHHVLGTIRRAFVDSSSVAWGRLE